MATLAKTNDSRKTSHFSWNVLISSMFGRACFILGLSGAFIALWRFGLLDFLNLSSQWRLCAARMDFLHLFTILLYSLFAFSLLFVLQAWSWAFARSCFSALILGGHHGFDLAEGLDHGTAASIAFLSRLFSVVALAMLVFALFHELGGSSSFLRIPSHLSQLVSLNMSQGVDIGAANANEVVVAACSDVQPDPQSQDHAWVIVVGCPLVKVRLMMVGSFLLLSGGMYVNVHGVLCSVNECYSTKLTSLLACCVLFLMLLWMRGSAASFSYHIAW